jgi:hypothetical protein
VKITVTPAPIPSTSATTDDLYADRVTITTDVFGDNAHVVKLHETASGARLSFKRGAIPFGDVPNQTQASTPFWVKNTGNSPADVMLTVSGAPFGVSPTQSSPVPDSGSLAASASFTPTSTGPFNGTISIATSDVLCAPLPKPLTLTGNGTRGEVSLSTQSLDFGDVACGSTAVPQSLHLKNIGTAPLTWSGALGKTNSPYTIDVMSGTLGAGQEVVITATPKAVPQSSAVTPGLYDDVFTITTNVPNDSPHAVQLVESALGAILSYPTSHSFGTFTMGTTSPPWPFSVTNSGNQQATVVFTPAQGSPFAFGNATISVATTAPGNDYATYTAPAPPLTSNNENVPVTVTSTALCAPLPGPIALSGSSL